MCTLEIVSTTHRDAWVKLPLGALPSKDKSGLLDILACNGSRLSQWFCTVRDKERSILEMLPSLGESVGKPTQPFRMFGKILCVSLNCYFESFRSTR